MHLAEVLGALGGGLHPSGEHLAWLGAALKAALGALGCSLEVLGRSLGDCCGSRKLLGGAILNKSNSEALVGSWGGCCGSWELLGGIISYMEDLGNFSKKN